MELLNLPFTLPPFLAWPSSSLSPFPPKLAEKEAGTVPGTHPRTAWEEGRQASLTHKTPHWPGCSAEALSTGEFLKTECYRSVHPSVFLSFEIKGLCHHEVSPGLFVCLANIRPTELLTPGPWDGFCCCLLVGTGSQPVADLELIMQPGWSRTPVFPLPIAGFTPVR